MFCGNCGSEIQEGSEFCSKCGKSSKDVAGNDKDSNQTSSPAVMMIGGVMAIAGIGLLV